jgi:hypothetical protein
MSDELVICIRGFPIQEILLAQISGGEMKNSELFSAGSGGQFTGLAGGEMILLLCHLTVFVQKHGFDKEMVTICGEI